MKCYDVLSRSLRVEVPYARVSLPVPLTCRVQFVDVTLGGNPIYAFEYIMTHGISKKEEYLPYHEKQGLCRYNLWTIT